MRSVCIARANAQCPNEANRTYPRALCLSRDISRPAGPSLLHAPRANYKTSSRVVFSGITSSYEPCATYNEKPHASLFPNDDPDP